MWSSGKRMNVGVNFGKFSCRDRYPVKSISVYLMILLRRHFDSSYKVWILISANSTQNFGVEFHQLQKIVFQIVKIAFLAVLISHKRKVRMSSFKIIKPNLPKCGNFMIFISFRFYVKAILQILQVQNLPFQRISNL